MKEFLEQLAEYDGSERIETLIRLSISEEQKAVSDYISRAEESRMLGFHDVATMYDDLANEETVHIGELETMLMNLDMYREEEIMKGTEEIASLTSEEQI